MPRCTSCTVASTHVLSSKPDSSGSAAIATAAAAEVAETAGGGRNVEEDAKGFEIEPSWELGDASACAAMLSLVSMARADAPAAAPVIVLNSVSSEETLRRFCEIPSRLVLCLGAAGGLLGVGVAVRLAGRAAAPMPRVDTTSLRLGAPTPSG